MASCLEHDLSCSVCNEIFRDPYILPCGHTFCRRCILLRRTCPVCLRCSHQNPVSNLALRSTCESYLREQETTRTVDGGGDMCPRHGLKIRFFCKQHREVLCNECRKTDHRLHQVQPLRQAVQHHKDQIRAALLPAEKALESLRTSSGPQCEVTEYNKSLAEQTEKQIKVEFEKLHHFLRLEEEARMSELRKEAQEKRVRLEDMARQDLQTISDRVMEVEETLQNNDVTFLKNFDQLLIRARDSLPKQDLGSENLFDVAKHVGNLKYKVWLKMKDLCPCYPVILDPNSASPNVTVSKDLTAISYSGQRFYSPNPLLGGDLNFNVLGLESQNNGFTCWEVEVGDNETWELGVSLRSLGTNDGGYSRWGLERDGDIFYTNYSNSGWGEVNVKKPPKIVRMQVAKIWKNDQRNILSRSLTISDAESQSLLCNFDDIPYNRQLMAFLTSFEKDMCMRIIPVKVNVTIENESSFLEKHQVMVFGFVMLLCLILVGFMMILIK